MRGRAGDARNGHRLATVAAAGVLLLAACSSGTAGTPAPASPSAAPATSHAAGVKTCVSSSEGPEKTCALEAGTYATEFFDPALTYTVPSAGWASLNREASPGNFHLFPPGGSLAGFEKGITDDITILSAVVAPGHCTGEPSKTVPQTFDGLVSFLTTNPNISAKNSRDVSIAGLSGKAFDVTFVASDGCPDGDFTDIMVGVLPSHGSFGLTPQMAGVRLSLLHVPGTDSAFAILVDDAKGGGSDYGDGDAWYGPAQTVIDSLVVSG